MRKCVLAIIVLSFVLNANAQILNKIGIKSGISLSNENWNYLKTDINLNPKYYSGFYFGVTTVPIQKKYIDIEVEAAYIQKGVRNIITATTVEPNNQGYVDSYVNKLDNRFDYISISALTKVKYPLTTITPYLIIGPRLDYNINSTVEAFQIVTDEFKKSIYGVTYGFGASYMKFEKIIPFIEIVNSIDFNKVYKTESLEVTTYSFEIKVGLNLK